MKKEVTKDELRDFMPFGVVTVLQGLSIVFLGGLIASILAKMFF